MFPPPHRSRCFWLLAASCSLALAAGCAEVEATAPSTRPSAPATGPSGAGVAVVELFTSEGCSSCPPADALLNRMAANAQKAGAAVYPLAFHVDYWDRLGWKDPFSAPAYTDRQRAYAAAFGSSQVYTPQMIVNGAAEFVGSDARQADQQVDRALKQPAPFTVTIAADPLSDPSAPARIHYSVAPSPPPGALLNLAVVERGLETKVPRGENAGRTLHHDNVVRAFKTIPLAADSQGDAQIPLPKDLRPDRASVIAYVQNPRTMKVLGAASSVIRPAAAAQ